MKTLKEQIEIMQHFANGGEVECINKSMENDEYTGMINPRWDWASYDYRIKEEKKTVTIEKWLCKHRHTERIEVIEANNELFESYGGKFEKLKRLETYEVEL